MARVRKPKWVLCYCNRIFKSGGDNCECVDPKGKAILKTGTITMKKFPTGARARARVLRETKRR